MTARVLDLTTVTPSELGRWADLGRAAIEPNPFFEAEFVLGARRARPGVELALVVSHDRTGGWRGALPMWRTRRWKGVPVPVSASWTHDYCFVGAPLLAAGADVADTTARLLDGAARAIGTGVFVGLDLVPTDGPVGALLDGADLGRGWRSRRWRSDPVRC